MKADQIWWLKAVALVLALAGVLWAQSSLEKNEVPKAQKILDQATEPIPAKVDFGK